MTQTSNDTRIRSLPVVLTKCGWTLRQIRRTGNVALYEQTKRGYKVSAYELILIRTSKPHPKDTGGWDRVERYPGDEDWGTAAWTFQDLETAKRKAESLLDRPSLHVGEQILRVLIAAEGEDSGSATQALPAAIPKDL